MDEDTKSTIVGLASLVLLLVTSAGAGWFAFTGTAPSNGFTATAVALWVVGAFLFSSIDVTGPLPREDAKAFISSARFAVYLGMCILLAWVGQGVGSWLAR